MFISLLVWYITEIDVYIVIEEKLSLGGILLGEYGAQYSLHVCLGYFWEDMVLSIHYMFVPIFLLTNGFTLALATFPTKEKRESGC